MAYGLLFLRVVVGAVFAAHGTQKLFGWWGGSGLRGTAAWLGKSGFRPPLVMAFVVAVSETSGLVFALGLVTPFAALALATTMVVAVGAVHWKNGFFSGNGGYEFNLALWAAVIAVAAIGPGRFSLDRAFGWDDNLSGVWWGVGVLAVSLGAAGAVLASRRKPEPG